MSRTRRTYLASLCLALLGTSVAAEQIVAAWNFNGVTETNSPPPSAGQGMALTVGNVAVSFASGAGSSDPASAGDNAWSLAGFPGQGKAPRSAGVEFQVSTVGFRGIGLRFDLRPSNTASRRVLVQYSVDGSSFADAAACTLVVGGAFTNALTASLSGVPGVDDNPHFAIRIISDFVDGTSYGAVSGNYGASGTWRFDMVTIMADGTVVQPGMPSIAAQPQSLERIRGTAVRFDVAASGESPMTYQWEFNGAPIPGAQSESLSLAAVGPSDAGEYRVVVANAIGRVTSAVAVLKVTEPPPPSPPAILYTNLLSHLTRPGDAPTNSFLEQSLRPGERLEIEVVIADPAGPFRVELRMPAGLGGGEGWVEGPSGDPLTGPQRARFVVGPDTSRAGQLYEPAVVAWNDGATNTVAWRIYLPTEEEQGIVLTEFLANPASTAGSPLFNPLRRDPPAEKPSQQDEYVELVNFGAAAVDLARWRLADSVASRHVFPDPSVLGPARPLIVYGGPRTGAAPGIEAWVQPGSEGIAGLGLNNDFDTVALYNAASNLVWRVVYSAGWLGTGGASARNPDRDGPFRVQGGESAPAVTPGRRFDGGRFDESGTDPGDPPRPGFSLTVEAGAGGVLDLRWEAVPGAAYSVWATPALDMPFACVARELRFEGAGSHRVESGAERPAAGFFRVSSP